MKVDAVEAANVKAAVDEALVTKVENPAEPLEEGDNEFARFDVVTNYLVQDTYEVGGSDPEFLNFEFTHQPRVRGRRSSARRRRRRSTFGRPPPEAECIAGSDKQRLRRARAEPGSLRLPPIVAFISSILLFGLGLLALHWREKDEAAAEAPTETAPAPVPAKV